MKITGIDFTSVPSRKKPITTVSCLLDGQALRVLEFTDLTDFQSFEDFLNSPGPWLAGLDFPFGQSRKLIENLGWPVSWAEYVELVAKMSREEFIDLLEAYKLPRAPGDKEHLREIDRLARSKSPQKLYGVPVGKMFFEGAKRLLNSPVSVLPVRPSDDNRIAVEAYPALVVRRWIDNQSYKSDTKAKQTDKLLQARKTVVNGIRSDEFKAVYGFEIVCDDASIRHIIDDATGDQMDALLCAIQAAWAWQQREHNFGIPDVADTLEGWIPDAAFI